MPECSAARRFAPNEIAERKWHQQQRFSGETRERLHVHDLADKAVGGEGKSEREADPRQLARLERQIGDAQGGERYGRPLQAIQPLREHDDRHQYIHQRRDEVTQTRINNVTVCDCPNVHDPVDADEGCGPHQTHEDAAIDQSCANLSQLPAQRHRAQHQSKRPNDAMRNDLHRRHIVQGHEIKREKPPKDERGERRDISPAGVSHRYARRSAVTLATKILARRSRPSRSAASKRASSGLSISSTPNNASRTMSGMTISERDAASQAMWPGNWSTSGTTMVMRCRAALPQTPVPSAMRTQAGLPWNGPTTRSAFLRK